MKQQHLVIVLVSVLLLGVVYVWTDETGSAGASAKQEIRLLENVSGESVAHVVLEQGHDKFELVLRDGVWKIPTRGNYPADGAKVRALLLKLFDLNVSQKLPTNPDSLAKLGLDDAAVAAGKSKISLLTADEKPVAVVRLGEARKGKNDSLPLGGMLNGQYVRRDNSVDVYAMANPIPLSFGLTSWIDANLVNVLPAAVMSVASFRVKDGAEVPEFELIRTGASEKDTGFPTFTLKGGVPPDKALQDAAVSQVRAALENLRMSDVFPADAPEVKDLVYDVVLKFRTTSALVYSVQVAQKGEKFYAKLSVAYDEALAAEVRAMYDTQAKAAPSPLPSPSAAPGAVPGAAASPSPSPSPSAAPSPTPQLSSAADAGKLNAQLSPWVYELVGFQAQQLRKSRAELIEPPQSAAPAAAAAPPPAGGAALPPDEAQAPTEPPAEIGSGEAPMSLVSPVAAASPSGTHGESTGAHGGVTPKRDGAAAKGGAQPAKKPK